MIYIKLKNIFSKITQKNSFLLIIDLLKIYFLKNMNHYLGVKNLNKKYFKIYF